MRNIVIIISAFPSAPVSCFIWRVVRHKFKIQSCMHANDEQHRQRENPSFLRFAMRVQTTNVCMFPPLRSPNPNPSQVEGQKISIKSIRTTVPKYVLDGDGDGNKYGGGGKEETTS